MKGGGEGDSEGKFAKEGMIEGVKRRVHVKERVDGNREVKIMHFRGNDKEVVWRRHSN